MTLAISYFERIPFTIVMVGVLIAAGVYGRSHLGMLDEDLNRSASFSMRLLVQGELHRIFTSLFFTVGGLHFYSSIAMFAICVGYLEWTQGVPRAVIAFFGFHVVTLLLMFTAVAMWLYVADSHRGSLLWDTQDVGPSAGYYGCLGLALMSASPQLRNTLVIATVTVLLLRTTWSWIHLPEQGRVLSADLAHCIAFALGILASRITATV